MITGKGQESTYLTGWCLAVQKYQQELQATAPGIGMVDMPEETSESFPIAAK